jgi:hypothetical protein
LLGRERHRVKGLKLKLLNRAHAQITCPALPSSSTSSFVNPYVVLGKQLSWVKCRPSLRAIRSRWLRPDVSEEPELVILYERTICRLGAYQGFSTPSFKLTPLDAVFFLFDRVVPRLSGHWFRRKEVIDWLMQRRK